MCPKKASYFQNKLEHNEWEFRILIGQFAWLETL